MSDYPYIWYWHPSRWRPIDRKGQACRVVLRSRMNSALVEFADGFRVVASRNALRKRPIA